MTKIDLNYDSFTYPWETQSFLERLKIITGTDAKSRIVYIYEKADNSTFRYRIYNMCEVINKSKTNIAIYFFVQELDFIMAYISRISCLVLGRVRWSASLDKLFCKAQASNVKLLFDVDDLVYDVTKLPMIMNTLGVDGNEHDYSYWFSYASRLFLTAKNCDEYITTNDFLANKIANFFEKRTHIVPNFINKAQMEVSESLWQIKEREKKARKNKKILLGYFSGSPSHNNDFKVISSDLIELMEKNSNVNLRIVGYLSLQKDFSKFIRANRVEFIPMQNYLNLQVKIAECNINLIPLQINEFTNCKSEIKYFDAAVVGTPTVATPTYIYKQIIEDKVNARLAMPGSWGRIIEDVLLQDNKKMLETAKEHATENYFGSDIIKKLDSVFC